MTTFLQFREEFALGRFYNVSNACVVGGVACMMGVINEVRNSSMHNKRFRER